MIDGRVRIRAALSQLVPAEHTPTPFTLTDVFDEELGGYAEVIVGPGARPVGFMTHGEGPQFTERVRVALEQLEMPEEASAHHLALARWFEHKRGFFKAEWHHRDAARGGEGPAVEPLAAIYFRRRPPIGEVVEHLAAWGVSEDVRERAAEVAATLEKDTIHFVSAAFRPGRPVHHKLYFSQWVTAETRPAVAARIGRVFERYGFGPGAREAWAANHERCLGPDDTTLFVSISGSAAGVSPTFKIDYPDVQPELAAGWVPAEQRAQVIEDARRAQALSGARQVTFLGVRFATDQPTPSLKYYGDVPGSQ